LCPSPQVTVQSQRCILRCNQKFYITISMVATLYNNAETLHQKCKLTRLSSRFNAAFWLLEEVHRQFANGGKRLHGSRTLDTGI